MHTKVIDKASRKLKAVRDSSLFMALAKIFSEAAKAAIKTIRGSRKAAKTLKTTEGLLVLPNCR